jgi:PAS domain-containing protein
MSNDHLTDIAYRHFIESVKDYAIYMLSADGTVISWNEGARRAKGYLSDEIIGRYFGLFYSEAEQLSGCRRIICKLPCVAGSSKAKAGGIVKMAPGSGRMS